MSNKKSIQININDYSEEVMEALDDVLERACEDAGMSAQKFAVSHISGHYDAAMKAVDTGTLRRSITYATAKVDDDYKVFVGTNVNYAYYVEMGTGDMGKGTGKPWIYYDKTKGVFRKTSGFRARPFIRPSIEKHTRYYKELFKMYLNGDA